MTTTTTTSGALTIGIGVAPTEQEREAFRAGLRREVAARAGGDGGSAASQGYDLRSSQRLTATVVPVKRADQTSRNEAPDLTRDGRIFGHGEG